MSRRSRLSRDQKRRKKRALRRVQKGVEPYAGRKYQGPEFAQALFEAEVAIHEADHMAPEGLIDEDVLASLEALVLELRGQGGAPEDEEPAEDLITWNIKQRWERHFDDHPRHSSSDLAGILRTIMNSVQIRWQMRSGPRGYLDFLDGFMADCGVRVQELTPQQVAQLEVVEPDDSSEAAALARGMQPLPAEESAAEPPSPAPEADPSATRSKSRGPEPASRSKGWLRALQRRWFG